jgi:hypothetical protein
MGSVVGTVERRGVYDTRMTIISLVHSANISRLNLLQPYRVINYAVPVVP